MRRNESAHSITGDRGHGLAELKGRDPMDRRIEVEKQEKYAQALREQLASRRGKSTEPATPGSGSSGCRLPSPQLSHAGAEVLNVESTLCSSGNPYPPTPERGRRTAHFSNELGHNRETSEKVGQVQELMRQRLQALQEEQHRQWDRIQAQLKDHAGFARDAAEQAVQRQIESSLETQIRPVLGDLAAARRECEAQTLRANTLADDLASLRRLVDSLHRRSEDHDQQLNSHEAEIDRLKSAHDECARFRAHVDRELKSFSDAMANLRAEQNGQASRMAEALRSLGQHDSDIERLKTAHEECVRFRAHVDRELHSVSDAVASVRAEQNNQASRMAEALRSLNQHASDIDHLKRVQDDCKRDRAEALQDRRALNDAMAQLKAQQEDLNRRVAEVPSLIKKFKDDVARVAERAARDFCERMRPEPQPLPPSPPPLPAEVSEEAMAVLRNPDGELYELPALHNIIGRAATCHASITGSQAISNRHASLDFDAEGRASIKDLESRNGTFLNERRVPREAGLVLESGDAIQLGVDGPTYTFEFGPAYYARWPSEPIRVRDRADGARRGVSSPPARGGRRVGGAGR